VTDAERYEAAFAEALAARDVDGCVAAILDLEQLLVDWAADTNISDESERARAMLRRMVLRLGELAATGARDPRSVLGPFVEALLGERARARAARDFAASDRIRDQLVAAGVEVRDTPDGAVWDLRPPG
jgi:cysteinyl-tRNA synthetase